MTREEAIRILASSCISGSKQTEALETLIPELAESEDERIRKELKEAFEAYDIESMWNGIPIRSIFAWLEKQKEQKPYEPHNWPADKDNLTQEQKPAEWSEEDENMRESAIALIRKWTNYSGENVGDSIKVISWLQWLPLLAHQH